jgi:hypothetical protein
MTVYDAVAGIDESALNQFAQSVYQAVHDAVLVGSHPVDPPEFGVTAIDYDVASAPQISLEPSSLVQARNRALLVQAGVPEEAADSAAAIQSQASFGLTIENLAISLHYADGSPATKIQASLDAGLQVNVEAGGVMAPSLVTLVINVPSEPALSDLINHGLVPELTAVINNHFLAPIQVPPIGLGGVQMSPPAVITGAGRLLATTALAPTVPETAPLSGNWPQQTVFAAVGAPVVNALLGAAASATPVTGDWHSTYRLAFISVTINAEYTVTISQIAVDVVAGADGQLRGTANLDGTVHLWAKNLFSVTSTVHATAAAQATAFITGNEMLARLDALDDIHVTLDLHNVPALIDGLISDIVNALGSQISAAVSAAVPTLPPRPITKIPAIPITVHPVSVLITLENPSVTTIQTPDAKTLVAMTGTPDVTRNQPETTHTANIIRPEMAAAGA